jgi:hypothetical protein
MYMELITVSSQNNTKNKYTLWIESRFLECQQSDVQGVSKMPRNIQERVPQI